MNLEDLKSEINDRFRALLEQLQESSAYNILKEKFQTLPTSQQKGLTFGALGLTAFLLVMIPFTYLSSSWEEEEVFSENRQLLLNLLKSSTITNNQSNVLGFAASRTAQTLRAKLSMDLIDEQIESVRESRFDKNPSFIPKQFETSGVEVKLKKLNLEQVVKIGHMLQSFSGDSKLLDMDVVAQIEDPHYYDVTYQLIGFNLPEADEEKPKSTRRPRGR